MNNETWVPLEQLIDLSGRVAVVTGGGAGIGHAISRRLAEAGARVIIADVGQTEHAVRTISDAGGTVSAVALDVTDAEGTTRVVDQIVEEHGRLDIWVNNAGIYPMANVVEMETAEWRRVMAVNLDGAFFGARAAGRVMATAGRGVILNVVSTSGFRVSSDGVSHYATSKWALRGLTQALARELGPAGVRALGVAPVFTATEEALGALADPAEADRTTALARAREVVTERYEIRVPLRRVASPDDIARVALFAVSDLAGFVTGSVIPVDGGFLAV